MRRMIFLIALLLFPIMAFASYKLWDMIDGGATHDSSGSYKLWGTVGTATGGKSSSSGYTLYGGYYFYDTSWGIKEKATPIPKKFYLAQNSPNPVTSATYIEYALPKPTSITLKVFDVTGRAIRALIAGNQNPGIYRVYWGGIDSNGKRVAPGIYFYRMEAHTGLATGEFKATRKLTILR